MYSRSVRRHILCYNIRMDNEKINKILEIVEDNNKILRGMRRSNRLSNIFRAFYWFLIIGVSIGAFYFIQPYIDAITGTYSDLQSNLNNVKSVTSNIQDLIKK